MSHVAHRSERCAESPGDPQPWKGTTDDDTVNLEVVLMTAEPRAEREGREWTASVNGTGLRVEEEVGSGKQTVVFSPNPFTNRGLFDAPVAALSRDYRCLRYDHRGQGDSGFGAPQPSPDLLGTEGLYDDAVALLDQLGVDRCHWSGHRTADSSASVWRLATRIWSARCS